MLGLVISIVLGVTYSQVLRHAQGRQRQMAWIGAVSYAVAAAATALLMLTIRPAPVGWREAAYGVAGGVAWVATYLSFNHGIRLAGVSITQCVAWLAVTVPVVAGIAVWSETPTRLQGLGLGLVLVALTLLLGEQPRGHTAPSRWRVPVLVAAFLSEGANTLAMKAYTKIAPAADDTGLLLCMFGSAAIGMAVVAVTGRARLALGEVGHGALLGTVAILANLAFLGAMRRLPAPVMFPSFWAGSVVLTAVTSMALWSERYRPRAIVGMAVAVLAMVLLHLEAH